MIIEEIKLIKCGKKDLQSFAVVMGIALAAICALFFWRGKSFYTYFGYGSIIFFIMRFLKTKWLKPFYCLWMFLGILLGWLVTRIILIVLFYLVITPVGLATRMLGKDFMGLKSRKNSYWILKEGHSDYEKQY